MAGTSSETQPSIAELISQAASQMSVLVRDEIALVRAEMVDHARHAARGAGMLATAAALAVYGAGLVVALAVVGLAAVWPLWAALLVVAALVLAGAAGTALAGRAQLRRATPLAPMHLSRDLATDVQVVKDAARKGLQ